MFRKRGLLAGGLVLICVCGPAFCDVKTEPKDDPFNDTSVFVEAFVVRVSTEGLIKSGVNPISKAPDGVSIINILWCLATDDHAKVVSQAKITSSHNQEGRLTRQENKYIKRSSASTVSSGSRNPVVPVVTNVCYDSYTAGNEFSVVPLVKSNDNVKIQAVYKERSFDENEDSAGPPSNSTIEWMGVLSVKPGVPAIAAAVQDDGESISFLILTVTIQGQQEIKKK